MIERYRGIWARKAILNTLVRRDLRVRYARSWLGYLWTIIDPLAMALIYFVVFAVIFKRPDAGHKPYFLFLLLGLLPWQWFNASINESARALVAEARARCGRRTCRASSGSFASSSPRGSSSSCPCQCCSPSRPSTWRRVTRRSTGAWSSSRSACSLQFVLQTGDRAAARARHCARRRHDPCRAHRAANALLRHPDHLHPQHRSRMAAAGALVQPAQRHPRAVPRGLLLRAPPGATALAGTLMSVGLLVWGAIAFARMERAVLKEI